VLECVLDIVKEEKEYLLVPMYAHHLRPESQARWYCIAMRGVSEMSSDQLTEWLEVA